MYSFYDRIWTIDFAVGLFGNFIFWVLDLVLIVILLPVVVRFLENRKWASARYAAATLVVAFLSQSLERIATYLETLTRFNPGNYRDPQDGNRLLVAELRNHMTRISLEFYNQFPIVSSSVSPEMSIHIAGIIAHQERLARYGVDIAEMTSRLYAKGTFVGTQPDAMRVVTEFEAGAASAAQRAVLSDHLIKFFAKAHRDEARATAKAIDSDIERIIAAARALASMIKAADKAKERETY